jgi:hypothetical protein
MLLLTSAAVSNEQGSDGAVAALAIGSIVAAPIKVAATSNAFPDPAIGNDLLAPQPKFRIFGIPEMSAILPCPKLPTPRKNAFNA